MKIVWIGDETSKYNSFHITYRSANVCAPTCDDGIVVRLWSTTDADADDADDGDDANDANDDDDDAGDGDDDEEKKKNIFFWLQIIVQTCWLLITIIHYTI